MRVLLINPPYPIVESLTMPLGLLYLAARLEQAGCEVYLEDLQLCRSPLTRLEAALRSHKPAVVGITSFSLNLSVASTSRTRRPLGPRFGAVAAAVFTRVIPIELERSFGA